jgi:hypothetical protein
MKFSLFAAALASTLLISACGDDTSSNPPLSGDKKDSRSTETDSTKTPGSDSSQSGTQSGTEKGKDQAAGDFTRTGTYTVDEANNLLMVAIDDPMEKACVAEGENLVWKSIPFYTPIDTSKYEFRGDTLIVYDFDDGMVGEGQMFVGGTPGKLDGTWRLTDCEVDEETRETECYEGETRYREITYTFSNGIISSTLKTHLDLYVADRDDFTNSGLMAQIYNVLNGSDRGIYPNTIFENDPSSVKAAIATYNITIVEQTKSHEVFEMNGKNYEVTIKKVAMTPTTNGLFMGNGDLELQMEVSDGTSVCNLNHVVRNVDESLCKDEYAGNIRIDDDAEDSNDVQYSLAYRYEKTSYDEFEDCLGSL